jgi:phage gp36-like protein
MAQQSLATLPDLMSLPGLPSGALSGVTDASKQAALDAASAYSLGKINGRYKGPLVSWDSDLTHAVCKIAVYDLLLARGYNPSSGADVNIRLRRNDADEWLTSVARGEISPNIVGQADQSPGYDNPRIISQPLQGWQGRRIG